MTVRGLLALTSIAVVSGVLPVATPAHGAATAAPTLHLRVVPLAGSASDLVYLTGTSAHQIRPFDTDQADVLHVRLRSGSTYRLGRLGPQGQVFARGPVVMVRNAGTSTYFRFRWWNVATGTHGVIASEDKLAGLTPDGWLTTLFEGGNEHLIAHTFSGHVTDLGDPAKPGVGYSVSTGATGLVIATFEGDEDFGAIRYMPWRRPGRFQTLRTDRNTLNRCGGMSSTAVGCTGEFTSRIGIFPLRGAAATIASPRCPATNVSAAPLMLHDDVVWLTGTATSTCRHDQAVGSLPPSGRVTYSSRRHAYSDAAAVTAFGELVVSSADQTRLLALSSVRAAPRTLATAH